MKTTSPLNSWSFVTQSIDAHHAQKDWIESEVLKLFSLISNKDYHAAEALIKTGVPINKVLFNTTALGIAAFNNDLEMINLLLKYKAQVSTRFCQGRDAAWMALEVGSTVVFQRLIDHGALLQIRLLDGSQTTRLIAATKASSPEMVYLLVNKKVNLNEYDSTGKTALHHNFSKDPYTERDAEIGHILLANGSDPNLDDKEGVPAHAYATTEEQLALLEGHHLRIIGEEVYAKARQHEEMQEEEDLTPIRPSPDDPGFPQIRRDPSKKRL